MIFGLQEWRNKIKKKNTYETNIRDSDKESVREKNQIGASARDK